MINHNAIIAECNYANDHRVRRVNEGDWYVSLNRSRRIAVVEIEPTDEQDGERVECPIRLEVCGMCEGSGSVVSPGIDSGGLTAEDFHDDPDFAEDYFRGRYDEPCPNCHGSNVEPRPDTDTEIGKRVQEYLNEKAQFEAECHAEHMAELRMGA